MSQSEKISSRWQRQWRDWINALPLADHPLEAELPAAAFGTDPALTMESLSSPTASGQRESPPTADALPPRG